MKTTFRWHWGYLPVLLLLGLLWYEFLKSSDVAPKSPSSPIVSVGPDTVPPTTPETPTTPVAPATPATPAAPVIAQTPTFAPTPTAPPTPVTPITPVRTPVAVVPVRPIPVTPTPAVIPPGTPAAPQAKAGELPPPISLSVNNASLDEVVNALNRAMNMPGALAVENPGNNGGPTYSLDVKNRPFWEVIQVLNAQNPFTINNNGNGGFISSTSLPPGITSPAVPTNSPRLTLYQSSESLRLARISGPAIIFPRSISYNKTGSGMAGAAPTPGRYLLNAYAIVDPRIAVARFDNINIIEAVDDAGRSLNAPSNLSTSSIGSNFISFPLQWNESDAPSKTATIKCELRFSAQTQSTEVTAIVEDAQTKIGDLITLGDRRVRIARFTVSGSSLQVELAPEAPGPQNSPVSFTITDATGKSVLSINNRPLNSVTAASIANTTGPYRLALRAPDHTQDFTFPFEFRDLPLP